MRKSAKTVTIERGPALQTDLKRQEGTFDIF